MNKLLIILVLFVLLVGGAVFYQLSQASQTIKTNGKVTIGNQTFNVEVAKSETARQIGLTKYKMLKDNQGMLFVFEEPGIYGFWMKNMKFPIDMLFINDNKVVSLVENATPPTGTNEPTIYKPDAASKYVLEIQSGLIKKYNIEKGDEVKIEL